ncbi:hypothetical protein ACFV1W_30320 [Kitasatospora sp. NPDC059648]|uniref:hypothetical protein n=1 Tax=Kitasatospora sp. NPDC059648 TaxID=3346894 RepID=UPI0036AE02B6
MEYSNLSVSITARQAAQMKLRTKRQKAEREEYQKQLLREGMSVRQMRLEIARVRGDYWPTLDALVAGCLRRRLAEDDLAGPWEPLTEEEKLGMSLSGRWPGPNLGVGLTPRSFILPSDLFEQLRTASWRVSEKPLAELGDRRLTHRGHLSEQQRAERERLAGLVHSPSRIVRDALDRYARAEAEPEDE